MCQLGVQAATGQELFVSQQIGCRVVGAETPRHSLELFAGKLAKHLPESASRCDAPEPGVLLSKLQTYRLEVPTLRPVDAAPRKDIVRGHMNVQAGSLMLSQIAVWKDGSDVRLIGRLVMREAGIAIDPVDRSLRLGNEFGCCCPQTLADLSDEQLHWGTHFVLVHVLALEKPFPPVITLQRTKEPQPRVRKARKLRHGRYY